MKKTIVFLFPDLNNKEVLVELDSSRSPKTVRRILDNLPVQTYINKWGDELYTDKTPIVAEHEGNPKAEVSLFDVAYWPEGNGICLFYGPTPISKDGKILAYSPVNIVGRIVVSNQQKGDILDKIRDRTPVIIKQI